MRDQESRLEKLREKRRGDQGTWKILEKAPDSRVLEIFWVIERWAKPACSGLRLCLPSPSYPLSQKGQRPGQGVSIVMKMVEMLNSVK